MVGKVGRAGACALGLALLFAGCSTPPADDDTQKQPPPSDKLGVSDGAGAGLKAQATAGPAQAARLTLDTGAEVDVAEGALESKVALSIERPSDEDALALVKHLGAGQKLASAPYVVTPHGTRFGKDVTVTLPIADGRDASKLKVVWLEDEEDTTWERLTTPTVVGDKASFKLNHFSVLALVEDESAPPPAGYVIFDGEKLDLTLGMLGAQGEDEELSRRRYGMFFANGSISPRRGVLPSERGRLFGHTFGMEFELYVSGVDSPPTGTHAVLRQSIGADARVSRWDAPVTGRESAVAAYRADSGSITISESEGKYLVTFDMQFKPSNDSGGPIVPLIGEYTIDGLGFPGLEPDKTIEIAEPTLTVTPPEGVANLNRFAWTGSRLWATGDTEDNDQVLVEIDPATGRLTRTVHLTNALDADENEAIWGLSFANGVLWEGSEKWVYDWWDDPGAHNIKLRRFDPDTLEPLADWHYTTTPYAAGDPNDRLDMTCWMHDGEHYWTKSQGGELYGLNESGTIVKYIDTEYFDRLAFGGGHFWATRSNWVYKLDKQFKVVDLYDVNNFDVLGYRPEIGFIDGRLWFMSDSNKFYRTDLE